MDMAPAPTVEARSTVNWPLLGSYSTITIIMNIGLDLKEIRWRGDSREAAHAFPKGARNKLGKELTRLQMGLQPRDGKALPSVGPGVQEIRIAYNKDAYRTVYVATLGKFVYILHAFKKKSKTGIETPKSDLDVAKKRYRDLVNLTAREQH